MGTTTKRKKRGTAGGIGWGKGQLPRGVESTGTGFRAWVLIDGKRKKSKTYRTVKQAVAWREALQRELRELPDDPATLERAFALVEADPDTTDEGKQHYRDHWPTLRDTFGAETLLLEIDVETVKGFKVDQLKSYKPTTVRHRMSLLRRIFNLARQERMFDGENPVSRVPLPKIKETKKDVFSREEIHWILRTMLGSTLPDARRDAAVVATLVETGVRITELARVRVCDVDLDRDLMTVPRGKSGDARYRPIAGARSYIEPLARKTDQEEAPFFGLNVDGLKNIFRRWRTLLKKAGLRDHRRFHAHAMRHTFATTYLKEGGDVEALRQAGGWKHLRTAQNYLHVENTQDRRHVSKLRLVPPLPQPDESQGQDGERSDSAAS